MKFCSTTSIKLMSARWAFAIFLLVPFRVLAQTDIASPYSIFGPGLMNLRQTVAQAGVGGSGSALFDSYRMNISNPAIVAYHLDPIFETSGKGAFSTFSTESGSFENRSFIINNLNLSFPIKRGTWGLTIGLLPYTTVGYDITANSTDPEGNVPTVSEYNGDGGISQGYLGMGYKVYERVDTAGNVTALAGGANMNFNFGTIDSNRLIYLPDDNNGLGFRSSETVLIRDLTFDVGVHYHTNVVKRTMRSPKYVKLLLGFTAALGGDLNAQRSVYAVNFRGTTGTAVGDTLQSNERSEGFIRMPARFTGGLGIDMVTDQKARFRFSLDFSRQFWSDYQVSYADDALSFDFRDSDRLSFGVEFTPEVGSTRYLRTLEFRGGFFTENTSLYLRDTQINNTGMSFGMTLPIHHRRGITRSAFHVAGQLGVYGTTDQGLIEEEYFRLFVGFSFTPHFRNRWFVQPKYD